MELIRVGLVLGASTAVRMAANLAVIKVIALQLGTGGMGVLGQFMSVVAITSAMAGGGIAMGLTKHVAQQRADSGRPTAHLRAGVTIWLVTGFVFGLLVGLNAQALSEFLLGTPIYANVFLALAAGQLAIGASNLLTAVVNGRQDVNGLAAIHTLTALAGAVLTVLLVAETGLVGAMWGLILAPCLGLLFAGVRVWRKGFLSGPWLELQPKAGHYKDLLGYTAMLAVTVVTMPLAQIVLRNWQADALSWHQVGLWQGLVKLSDAWLQFAMLILSSWYYPRLSRCTEHAALHAEFRTMFITCAAVLTPAAACIWLLRRPLIDLLFAPDFRPLAELLAPQLIGDVLRTLSFVIGYIAVAKAQTQLYMLAELFQAGTLLLLSYLLLPALGAHAVPVAYLATYALYCLACLAVYRQYHAARGGTTP